jgi:hypothetical protein
MSMDKEFEATWAEGETPAAVNPAEALTATRQADEAKTEGEFAAAFAADIAADTKDATP